MEELAAHGCVSSTFLPVMRKLYDYSKEDMPYFSKYGMLSYG